MSRRQSASPGRRGAAERIGGEREQIRDPRRRVGQERGGEAGRAHAEPPRGSRESSPTRGIASGCLASVKGAVSTMYLLARSVARSSASSARLNIRFAICSSISRSAAANASSSSRSIGSRVASVPESLPWKYRCSMDSVRLTRLPTLFARSPLIAGDESLLAEVGVEPEHALAEQEVAKGVVAVLLDHRPAGAMTLPRLFDILSPSTVQ